MFSFSLQKMDDSSTFHFYLFHTNRETEFAKVLFDQLQQKDLKGKRFTESDQNEW